MIAELLGAIYIAARFLKLQWGRDQLIAELWPIWLQPTSTLRLQWGRDQLIAELVEVLDWRSRAACFNGAAIN